MSKTNKSKSDFKWWKLNRKSELGPSKQNKKREIYVKKLKRKSPYLLRKLWPGLLVTAIGSRELYWDLEMFLLLIPFSLKSLTNNTSTNHSHRPGDSHASLSNWSLFWETSGVQVSSGQVVLQQVLTSFQVDYKRRHNQEWVMIARFICLNQFYFKHILRSMHFVSH